MRIRRMSEESVVAYFEFLFHNFLGKTEETIRDCIQEQIYWSSDLSVMAFDSSAVGRHAFNSHILCKILNLTDTLIYHRHLNNNNNNEDDNNNNDDDVQRPGD
jgi:hypothetical protein